MKPTGRSVKLFLADGSATGILTAEIMNWTGHVVAGPRTRIEAALKRPELKRTGIYLIFGNASDSDLPMIYVGEGDNISTRLSSHSKDDTKDFWERFVTVTSKDMNLTKAHVKYLEGRIIALLKQAKKTKIANKTEPTFDLLPEADISDMEAFLEELQLVLPVIGVDFLRKPTVSPQMASETTTYFSLINKRKCISARAAEIDGEFVVFSGSVGSLHETVSFSEKQKAFRSQVIDSERAKALDSKNFKLTEDVAFSSPSAASVFLHGTARNGRIDWVVEGTSTTYGDRKDALLSQ